MGFGDAVRAVMSKYAAFTGRARRSEFWYWFLAIILAEIVIGIIGGVLASASQSLSVVSLLLYGVLVVATIVPSLAVTVRRLHDTGRSGWWWFISLVPAVGPILLIVWYCTPGTPGSNAFGPDPTVA
jgi:uncharacterized membrane protein YhaH (DUF805 family)